VTNAFTISTDRIGTRRWVQVRIHPDAEHLERAAYRTSPARGRDWWTGSRGCFHTARFKGGEDGWPIWPPSGYAGILRLALGWITEEIVAHELVHAALQVYRMNVKADVRLSNGCGQREEQLAYIYGELAADMRRHLNPA
jgi:hypothetical protein